MRKKKNQKVKALQHSTRLEDQDLAVMQDRPVETNSSEKILTQVMDTLPQQVCQGEVCLCPQQNKINRTMRRTMTKRSRTVKQSHIEDLGTSNRALEK